MSVLQLAGLGAGAALKELMIASGLANPDARYLLTILNGAGELQPFELDGELFAIQPQQLTIDLSREKLVEHPPGRDGSIVTDLGRPSYPISVTFGLYNTVKSPPLVGTALEWEVEVAKFNAKLRGDWAYPVTVRSPLLEACEVDLVIVQHLSLVTRPGPDPHAVAARLDMIETDDEPLFSYE